MNSTYDSNEFKKVLNEVGLVKDDYVFVHSSLKTLGKYEDKKNLDLLEMIKNTILNFIGDNGLIVVPTFNFDFAKGVDFNVNNSPATGMGAFSEFVRRHPDSNRTRHPMHSISMIGANSKYISNLEGDTEFSDGSAFDHLLKKNCKILYLGNSFTETFFHIAEEKAKVPYRFWKPFKGNLIENSVKKKIEIQYYARDFSIQPEPKINVSELFKFLDNKNIFTKSTNDNINLMICSSSLYVDHCYLKLKENSKYFLTK